MRYKITAIYINPEPPIRYNYVQISTIDVNSEEEGNKVVKWCEQTFSNDLRFVESYSDSTTNSRGWYLWLRTAECLTAFMLKYR